MPNNVIVPEIGTKCIYPVLDAEKIKYFCIQKDGVIVKNNNHKVSQTQENTHFLEHSTDTTAMRSFDNATIIGVVFALCATWFAWWCAKKSFELTKLSFDSLIQQIKDSTQSTLDTNMALIQSQERINQKEILANRHLNWVLNLREVFAVYISNLREIRFESSVANSTIRNEKKRNSKFDQYKDEDLVKKLHALKAKLDLCELNKTKIELLLNHLKENHANLIDLTERCYNNVVDCFTDTFDQSSSDETYRVAETDINYLVIQVRLLIKDEEGE
ncbi:hypothetical protein SB581_07250 [Acinetobacter baumannii]|nr:hypothetical protein SB581_07250 [Acinetobacter baumannii]